MDKIVIEVNDIEYHSYSDLCRDFNIDYREFMKYENENHSLLELMEHFFSKVIAWKKDRSYRVSGLRDEHRLIKAWCPCCGADRDDIVYQNSGPIVRIYCSKCGLVYNEGDAKKKGFDDIIDYWNHIGVYMPMD